MRVLCVAGGIIPAYAGSTRRLYVVLDYVRGSSPHTRGARDAVDGVGDEDRIIPAYAGSTGVVVDVAGAGADHPRIRGEHPIAAKPDNLVMGSSPHTRGARGELVGWADDGGIIPAYAGSTPAPSCGAASRRDHPRIRGEHRALSPPCR